MRKGFTLIELIIVVIVVGILATIAIPQYLRATERARGSKAITGLTLVAQGLKMYRADNDTYLGATLANINTDYVELGTEIATNADPDWNYAMGVLGAGTFSVTATRKPGGTNAGEIIQITQAGLNTAGWTP